MSVAARMREKLERDFSPDLLEIVDESEKHRGHGGWREGGETHFRIRMVSPAFRDLGRVARSRAVHKALAEELAGPVHALALDLSAP